MNRHFFVPKERNDRQCKVCNWPDMNPIHNTEDVLDLSPLELTDEVAKDTARERIPVVAENLARIDVDGNRKFLEYNLAQQIKSLAYLLQDLLLTSGHDRAAGAMDSVNATLGEVGKQLYTNLTGEPADEPDEPTGSVKKVSRRSTG